MTFYYMTIIMTNFMMGVKITFKRVIIWPFIMRVMIVLLLGPL